MDNINNISYRTIWRILFTASVYIGLLLFALSIRRELIWLGTAIFLAFALDPAVSFFARFMPRRNRGLAIGTVFVAIIATFLVLALTLLPPLITQTRSLARTLPDYAQRIEHSDNWLGNDIRRYNVVERIKSQQNQLIGDLTNQSSSIFGVLGKIFTSLAALVTIIAATFFMLLEGPLWIERFWEIVPVKYRKHNQKLANKMYEAVTSYVIGTFIACSIGGAATAVMLAILHVPFAIPLGILVALLLLVPIVGGLIAGLVVTIICLFSSVSTALIIAIFFTAFLLVDNHVVRPLIYGKAVGVSPLLVLISIVIGTASVGFIGALVAIPVAASLQIIAIDYVTRYGVKTKLPS